MNKTMLATGLLFGIMAIVLGAFGAHGLKKILSPEELNSFEVGIRYQMYHALLMVLVGSVGWVSPKFTPWVYGLVVGGIILFSFSIYLLATNKFSSFDFKTIGWVTPIGGFLLIIAWGLLLFDVLTKKGSL